jgi:CheY-like chemotaxis protein
MLAYSGKGHFVIESIDLSTAVEGMVHLLKTVVPKKVLLNLDLAAGLPPVRGDATQVRQIVMNLVLNAAEAIGERSGVVTVCTGARDCSREYLSGTHLDEEQPEGLYVWVEVSDTGCGMDAQTQARIFDPFFSTKFTGRGLGLAAVLGIVRGHRGALKVYSEPDKGTTMRILLPAAASEAPGETAPAPAAWRGAGTVLLVDDEETVRATGRHMLERLGFDVLTANDGREALQVYAAHADEIALVLLDLTMPHLDGEETFRELRRLYPGVRVVMSSGYSESDITARFAGKGLAGFVQKPYDLATLQERLRAAGGKA